MAERAIIGLADWFKTPAGCYVLQWEQAYLDTAVADLFGFHALQLGLPELDALRANRMLHRWVATEAPGPVAALPASPAVPLAPVAAPRSEVGTNVHVTSVADADADIAALPPLRAAVALHCDFDALPFDAASLDLLVLPHALELARDPHLALREVERVLVPEGRVVIVGFNPSSLWGVRQGLGRLRRRFSAPPGRELFLPAEGEFLGFRRLRDWLRLLSFEVEAGRFGCYRPPLGAQKWLSRFAWADRVGERWWPVFGAVYFVVAVKRVRGMRLVGLARASRRVPNAAAAPVTVANHRKQEETETA
jgi:SAM-dependent methyltransferase